MIENETIVASGQINNFLPSRNGFKFSNYFSTAYHSAPFINDADGMCGGMVYAVIDYYKAGLSTPEDTLPPTRIHNNSLLEYIRQRQKDSVLQLRTLNYLLAFSLTPEKEKEMVLNTYEIIKKQISQNELIALGLIRSREFKKVKQNHQVGVYGYQEDAEGNVILKVYDPKDSTNDNVTMSFNKNYFIEINCSTKLLGTVYTFFESSYTFCHPEISTSRRISCQIV
jgi:hypothetical protein